MSNNEAQLGLYSNVVRLESPSAEWRGYYENEALRVAGALAQFKPLIEHIGSTAVPNLCAKPVIDVMIGVGSEALLSPAVKALEQIGYVGHGEKGIPGRQFLTLGEPRTHHAHLVVAPGEFWDEHILFRDYLAAHAATAADYAAQKESLARLYPLNRDAYTEGKSDFIRRVLDLARAWRPPSHP